MKEWISTKWKNPFKNPTGLKSDRKILIADIHYGQQTDCVKELLKKHKTSLVNVPTGCMSRVKVVDVLINKSFKDEVLSLFEDHMNINIDQYVDGRINASQPRFLMTKCVGEAWSKV